MISNMRLRELYKKEIAPKLVAEFGYKSVLAVPKLLKVSINVGVGKMTKDKQFIESVVKDLETISGQKPVLTKAKKSISAFNPSSTKLWTAGWRDCVTRCSKKATRRSISRAPCLE